ncbi:MAG: hypothetical protein HY361_00690 [Candidatus Aenigmarchaeota archaeon]|nr:hypothetical protein [Candidatus Aenigmarchaeota archaeon]
MNKRTRVILVVLILVTALLSINLVSSQPEIDSEIEGLLESQGEVRASITLVDQGSMTLNLKLQQEIVSNLSEEEFRLEYVSSIGRWFSGNMTSDGFEKLKNYLNISGIHIPLQGTYPASSIPEIKITETERYCEEDSECVIVQRSCCDCNNGGQADIINEKYINSWEDRLRERCGSLGCNPFTSNNETCSYVEVKCSNNKCIFVDAGSEKSVWESYNSLLFIALTIILISFIIRKKKK